MKTSEHISKVLKIQCSISQHSGLTAFWKEMNV